MFESLYNLCGDFAIPDSGVNGKYNWCKECFLNLYEMIITLSIKYYHRKINSMKMEHDVEIYINCSYSILKVKVTTLTKFINNW